MQPGIDLRVGDGATDYRGADLVCSNLYGPVPKQLVGKPSIVSLFEGKGCRRDIAERWISADLQLVSAWGKGGKNAIYVANLDIMPLRLDDLVEDIGGWFPLELPMRLLEAYARPGMKVWDGYMGRGTVGKACIALGLTFVGGDIDPARVAMARRYLNA